MLSPPSLHQPTTAAARFLAAYILLPNVAFAIAGQWLYLERPLLNLDYVLIGVLTSRLGRRPAAVLLGLGVANDLVINAAPACHFTLPDFLRSLANVDLLPPWAVALLGLAITLVSGVGATSMVRLAGTGASGRFGLGAMVLLGGLAAAQHRSGLWPQHRFASSGLMETALALLAPELTSAQPAQPTPPAPPLPPVAAAEAEDAGRPAPELSPIPSAGESPNPAPEAPHLLPAGAPAAAAGLLAAARNLTAPLPKRNQALIVVESLGLFRDAHAAELLLSPLTRLSQRYSVGVGAVPFRGETMSGELRELCPPRAATELGHQVFFEDERHLERIKLAKECLPALLAQRGFRTVALHGFTRRMYWRFSWYPKVGFQVPLFLEELRAQGLSRECGVVWGGLCDPDVATRMLEELKASRDGVPRFVYWMTLNSHLPEQKPDLANSPFDCSDAHPTGDSLLCYHARTLSAALAAVARVASEPGLPPTDFIVVGDHAPPFWGNAQREAFDPDHVPYVTLTWRE